MLECVVNVSEGRDEAWLRRLAAATDGCVDLHLDGDHHRSVLTILGRGPELVDAVLGLGRRVVERLDLGSHVGVHPRIGVLDVVPFVPIGSATIDDALAARDACGLRLAAELGLPCFLYGPEGSTPARSLPELRRRAFVDLEPDIGPRTPHPTAGASALGAREPLLAWNLLLEHCTIERARTIAKAIRGPQLRALGLEVSGGVQVSCNLLAPSALGPDEVADRVRSLLRGDERIAGAELVGLAPLACLERIDPSRWASLDLSEARTIEARLAELR